MVHEFVDNTLAVQNLSDSTAITMEENAITVSIVINYFVPLTFSLLSIML